MWWDSRLSENLWAELKRLCLQPEKPCKDHTNDECAESRLEFLLFVNPYSGVFVFFSFCSSFFRAERTSVPFSCLLIKHENKNAGRNGAPAPRKKFETFHKWIFVFIFPRLSGSAPTRTNHQKRSALCCERHVVVLLTSAGWHSHLNWFRGFYDVQKNERYLK